MTSEASPSGQNSTLIHSNTPIQRNRRIERSCVLCHRRKVRCDKKLPCGTCVRTGVLCCYPSGREKTAPRKEKTTISDIANRLVQLERTIVAISSSGSGEDANFKVRGADRSLTSDGEASASGVQTPMEMDEVEGEEGGGDGPDDSDAASSQRARPQSAPSVDEMLVRDGQYVNEVLLSRVLEEEREIQSVLATRPYAAATSDSSPDPNTPRPRFSLLSLSGATNADLPPSQDLFPQKWQAMRLWTIYLQNVDSMSKLLHIPTAQVTVFTAVDDCERAAPDVRCLLFALFFCATTSLEPDEVASILGQGKVEALDRFRQGLDQSLVAAKLLDTPSLTTLQALGMFMQAHRATNTTRSAWILNGLAIRAAQSVGLHRDGSRFNLRPFESEMRRRVWWHIMSNDGRAAEDHGLAVSSNSLDFTTDTRLPLMVDDSALDPDMDELPPETTSRWTQMTLQGLLHYCNLAIQQIYSLLASLAQPNSGKATSGETARQEVLRPLKEKSEAVVAVCNPVIPIQRVTICISRVVVAKLDFISRLQLLNLQLGSDAADKRQTRAAFATDANLADACHVLELNHEMVRDEMLRNYRWVGESYPQYHVLMYILWHLCARPIGPHIDRAWREVNMAFRLEEHRRRANERGDSEGSGSKWGVMSAMRDKALRVRESLNTAMPHPSGAADQELEPSNAEMAAAGTELLPDNPEVSQLDGMFDGEGSVWDSNFTDWDALMDYMGSAQTGQM